MILKIIFRIQGVILIISGLAPIIALETWLQMNRMGDINQLVVGMSLDSLPVLGRGFGIMLIAMGVVVFLIPNWVGNNLRGPAIVAGLINTVFVLNIGYDINAGHIGGASTIVNLMLVLIFAIIFFIMGARHQNS